MLSPEEARRILYPVIITALSTLLRTITTKSLFPVTTALTKTVLGDVAVPPYTIMHGQISIRPVQ
jgi:hypothetical protein